MHLPRNTRPVPEGSNKGKGRDGEAFLSAESLAKIIFLPRHKQGSSVILLRNHSLGRPRDLKSTKREVLAFSVGSASWGCL